MNGGTTPLYAVNRPINEKLSDFVSVLDFSADPDGVLDSSNAITSAIATGKAVYFPKGTYLCNVNINTKTVLYGDGSTESIIKPFVYTSPAMVYTYAAQQNPITGYWNYHSEVRNLGFQGTGSGAAATGIGFSFGSGNPATYTAGAEYANNVTFYNCFFSKLEKGVQFPFGNIGSQFYSCGFQNNYYGVYMLDNKSGSGDPMHAGNKYFYNGEFDYNVCAVYVNNNTDGFGAIAFTDTIFEYNSIGFYIKNTQITTFTPIQFKDCWYEGNGTLSGATTATIDVWTGNTKTTSLIGVASYIIYNGQTIIDGGFATGIFLQSNNSRVTVKNSRVETNSSFGGQANSITYADANIFFENCISASGYVTVSGYSGNGQCVGFNTSIDPSAEASAFTIASRFRYLPTSYNVLVGSGLGGTSQTFETAQGYSGASFGTGTVISDGSPKYLDCNSFSFVYANASQYYYPTNASLVIAGGSWIAFTCDVRLSSATSAVFFSFGNLSTVTAGQITLGVEGIWRTVGGVAYVPNTATLSLWVGTGAAQTAVINISAFQCKVLASQGDAENFIASRTYLE